MPLIGSHGGSCCGMRHLFGFEDEYTKSRGQAALKSITYYGKIDPKKATGYLFEVVLVDDQLDGSEWGGEGWAGWLKETGFREVSAFTNANSGNVCHVFHLITGGEEKVK